MDSSTGPVALIGVQRNRRSLLWMFAIVVLAVFALADGWKALEWAHEAIEMIGRMAIVVCILGRCWCTLYIGGKKGATLVETGPYSICRNPLYFFSFLGAAGAGVQTGSLVVGLGVFAVTYLVFRSVVLKEEAYLSERFGEPYLRYLKTTPRFLPNPTRWKGVDLVEVRPKLVVLTFVDSMLFVISIPLAEGLEKLQHMGYLPVLLNLP